MSSEVINKNAVAHTLANQHKDSLGEETPAESPSFCRQCTGIDSLSRAEGPLHGLVLVGRGSLRTLDTLYDI